MDGDEDDAMVSVGNCGAIVERRVLVTVAGEDDVKSQPLQFGSHYTREPENHIFFHNAVCSTRAQVRPAMGSVEHNHDEPMRRLFRLRRWRGRWRCGRRGLRRLLGRLRGWLQVGFLRPARDQSGRQRKDYESERDSHGEKA